MTVDTDYGKYPENFAKYIRATTMCDFDTAMVRKTANTIKENANTALQAIREVHEFVSQLPEGFDRENKPASFILKKGRGQCNTKTTLYITLLRAIGVPARPHAWKIHKIAHQHHLPVLVYFFTPKTTIFTYPEVYYKDKWQLLSELLKEKGEPDWNKCPFDDAPHREHPLKKEWIAQDLGAMWHPDDVYAKIGTNTKGWRSLAFPIAQLLLN